MNISTENPDLQAASNPNITTDESTPTEMLEHLENIENIENTETPDLQPASTSPTRYFCPQQQSFYDSSIHERIPENAITITEAQHHELLAAINRGAKILPDLRVVERPSLAHVWHEDTQTWRIDPQHEAQLLTIAKAQKIAQLNQCAQSLIAQLAGTDQLPAFEIHSWALQAAEAKAWAHNPESATPILDEIAHARGIAPETLKAAALRKTLAYERLSANIVGQRQALQTQIEGAKNMVDLDRISMEFHLPEHKR